MIIEPLLGTRAEVVLTAVDPEMASEATTALVAEIRRLEQVFSRFDESSDLHAYRRTGTSAIPELLEVIDLATAWRRRSNGAFHAEAQPLVDLWDRAEAVGVAPTATELQRTIDTMSLGPNPAMLDLNAIAKGWIADAALTASIRARSSVTAGWLNLGGDIVHRGDGSVRAGIEDPLRPYDNAAPVATVELSNEALATSGGAHRRWTIAGVEYPKVIDPRSGMPGTRMASATVVANDGAAADALATIAVFLEPYETLQIAEEVGAECFLIDQRGSVTTSSDRFR